VLTKESDLRELLVSGGALERATLEKARENRILDRPAAPLVLDEIGMRKTDLVRYRSSLDKPSGIILVTGPARSGKTTTLYSSLVEINDGKRKIITVEDQIELQIEGIQQMQVFSSGNEAAKSLTFAGGLRAMLRRDPDVIMIGEIRDLETAMISIVAGMTGHLVLSALHSNHAFEVPKRVRNLGLEPHHFTDAALVVVAQRLVRRICGECKRAATDVPGEIIRVGLANDRNFEGGPFERLWKGEGCAKCGGTGYFGKTGVFEVMPISDRLKTLVARGVCETELRDEAIKEGMSTLLEAAREKVLEGETTLDEYQRIAATREP
jgi:type II secretory ATPase GspE/PulE/Tfp pilus assembly ATPase PilB-like protein